MTDSDELPYIKKRISRTVRLYNPNYGNDRICVCGHPYYRHFDPFEPKNEQDVGCKYCFCDSFKEASPAQMLRRQWMELLGCSDDEMSESLDSAVCCVEEMSQLKAAQDLSNFNNDSRARNVED